MVDFAREIARAALKIGAITLSPNKPYQWASGYFMPIYNDNRKHLAYPENRKLITDSFKHNISKNEIHVDMISGTSTSGIAPAASLAQDLKVPMNIFEGPGDDQIILQYKPDFIESLMAKISDGNYDIVISTCPAAIIPAVSFANERELPFGYVRESLKKHGLMQQIEGVVKSGQKAVLVDFFNNYSYAPKAKEVLEGKGVEVVKVVSEDIFPLRGDVILKNRDDLHVEDLVSTGGSCIDEIQAYRRWGARVVGSDPDNNAKIDWCNAIFSYDFPESLKKFDDINCKFDASSRYLIMLEVALEENKIEPVNHEMLKEWRADAFKWGAKHGFPPVEKKA